jgi:hypothetical protein
MEALAPRASIRDKQIPTDRKILHFIPGAEPFKVVKELIPKLFKFAIRHPYSPNLIIRFSNHQEHRVHLRNESCLVFP